MSHSPANVPPAPEDAPEPDQVPAGARLGVFAVSACGLLFALWLGGRLPAQVASHFGAAGEANGWMSRDAFVAFMLALLAGMPVLLQAGLALALRLGGVNIPHAQWWLAPPRRAATVRSLHVYVAWLAGGITAFLAWVGWQVAAANRAGPHAALDPHAMLLGVGAMLLAMMALVTAVVSRFQRPGA